MLDKVDLAPEGALAIKAWNWLQNGSNAIDWAGLPIVCALLGVRDVERLLHDLLTIKTHMANDTPPDQPPPTPQD